MASSRVSIGMPVFNGEHAIRESVGAILNQTFEDFELVIADNCSEDNTWAVCNELAASDSRIKLVRNDTNVGASENFNVVYRHSNSPYFKWASCNDLCAPSHIEKCVEVLDARADVVVAYPRTRLIEEDGTIVDYDDGVNLSEESPIERFQHYLSRVRLNNVEQGLLRREVMDKTNLQRNFLNNDTILMAEMSLHGKFFEIPEFLFYRRMGNIHTGRDRTPRELAKFYKPDSNADGLSWQVWRQMLAFGGVWLRAPVAGGDRIRLALHIGKVIRWSAGALTRDALSSTKRLLG